MAMTRDRLSAPDPPRAPSAGETHRPLLDRGPNRAVRRVGWGRLDGSISSGWAKLVGLAWVVVFAALPVIEPAPADPSVEPATGGIVAMLLLGLLGGTATGLVTRRRWGLLASLGGGVLLAGLAVACPVTGHHALGAWWIGELGLAAGIVGVSLVGLRRT